MWVSALICLLLLPEFVESSSSASSSAEADDISISIHFEPTNKATVGIDSTLQVDVNITCVTNVSCDFNSYFITFECQDSRVARVEQSTRTTLNRTEFFDVKNGSRANFTITLRGIAIGKTRTQLQVFGLRPGESILLQKNSLATDVIREDETAVNIFVYLLVPILIMTTASFGCKLKIDVIKQHFRRPIGILIGFVCQYGIMPTVAYTAAKVAKLPSSYAFGLLAIGCSPGGGMSNVWSFLLGGDLDLSISMTFCSTVAALGMMPLWLYTAGREFLSEGVSIPYQNIFISLVSLVVPLIVGVLVKRYLPRVAEFAVRIIQPILLTAILIIIPVGIYANYYVFAMIPIAGWPVTVTALSLPFCGYLLGGLFAFITRRSWKVIKTVAIETGIQNTGIAMVILRIGYPQPDADMASLSPLEAAMFTPLPLLVSLAIRIIYLSCTKDTEEKQKIISKLPCCIIYAKIKALKQKFKERNSLFTVPQSPIIDRLPEKSQNTKDLKEEYGSSNDAYHEEIQESDEENKDKEKAERAAVKYHQNSHVEDDPRVEDDTPVKDDTPVEDNTTVEDNTPLEDNTPVEDNIPVEDDAPVEDDTPVKGHTSVENNTLDSFV